MPLDLLPSQQPLSLQPGSLALNDSVRELMGRPPHWLLRSGATMLSAVIGILIILSAIISYPDMITSRLTVTGSHSVVEVMARQSGHLQTLKVKEKQMVKQGDVLAVIESPCDAEAFLNLRAKLDKLPAMLSSDIAFVKEEFPSEPKLGKLQDSFSDFLAAYSRLLTLWGDDYTTKTIALLASQLESKLSQVENMREQQTIMDQELKIAQEKYERMKALYQRGTISAVQMKEHETMLLNQTRERSAIEKNLIEEQILASRLDKEIGDIKHDRTDAMQTARDRFRLSYQKLRAEMDIWEADYVLKAPANGMVAFYDFWNAQQYVTAGQQVFIIVPETSSLRGRMTISQGGTGKIKQGQLVRIKFDDFPSKDFGIVTGRVQSLSLVARGGANQVLVELDYPIISSYQKSLQFKQEMAGEASIITENSSLLGRIFYEIRKAFHQSPGS